MVEILILAVGLIALVEDPANQTVHLVMLETKDSCSSWGESYPKHTETLAFQKDYYNPASQITGPLTIKVDVSRSAPSADPARFLQIGELLGVAPKDPAAQPRKECLLPTAPAKCLDRGTICSEKGRAAGPKPLVKTLLSLVGPWSIGGVEVKATKVPRPVAPLIDRSQMGFVATDGKGLMVRALAKETWGAFLLSATVETAELKKIRINGKTLDQLDVQTKCKDFIDDREADADCIPIIMDNRPVGAYGGAHAHGWPTLIPDKHFERFYELLEVPPATRYLPMTLELDVAAWVETHGGGAGTGAGRCPSGRFLLASPPTAP